MKKILLLLFIPFFTYSQDSLNMSLLGSYSYPTTQANDIWGWVDSIGNEYAIVGLRSGVSVVDVTIPNAPVEKFFIPDINSTWRDLKTFSHYAYVTTEANAGLLIIDLHDMSGNTYVHVKDFYSSNNDTLHFEAAHDLFIDENGIIYIFGASNPSGFSPPANGAIFLDPTNNPLSPEYLGEWNDEYIHDAMIRNDTMWAGCVYAGKVFVVDVSDKSNPSTLGSATTPDAFTHNAWPSDNGNYVFTTDEKSDGFIAAYDVTDMNNIQEVDRIQSNPGSNSIPHNTFVDGNFLITSYYRDGTTVHDITYPDFMVQVGYYDSYSGSGNGFDGCWGTYPYLPSGNIISSDINSDSGNAILNIYNREFQQACYLNGFVYDSFTNNIISNASIEILGTNTNTTTNLIGKYQTAVLDSSLYDVVFTALGYISDTISVLLVNGVMTTQDAYLSIPCDLLYFVIEPIICENDSFNVGLNYYSSNGVYFDTLTNSYGCDSIMETILTILPNSYLQFNDTICSNESYFFANNNYTVSGSYSDTLSNILSCDSIVSLNLFVLPYSTSSTNYSICSGDSVTINNNSYFTSGTYLDTLVSSNLCDSIIVTNLVVNGSLTYLNEQTICFGENYSIGNSSYSSPGIYFDILVNQSGCDSNVATNLSILPTVYLNQNINICSGESYNINFNNYSSSGVYIDTLSTLFGCDSIITTELEVDIPTALLYLSANTIIANVSNGVSPYTYTMFGPNNYSSTFISNGGGEVFYPTTNGIYLFYATDAVGCITDTLYLEFNLNVAIDEIKNNLSDLSVITDLLGREVPFKYNTPLLFIYKNGIVMRKYFTE